MEREQQLLKYAELTFIIERHFCAEPLAPDPHRRHRRSVVRASSRHTAARRNSTEAVASRLSLSRDHAPGPRHSGTPKIGSRSDVVQQARRSLSGPLINSALRRPSVALHSLPGHNSPTPSTPDRRETASGTTLDAGSDPRSMPRSQRIGYRRPLDDTHSGPRMGPDIAPSAVDPWHQGKSRRAQTRKTHSLQLRSENNTVSSRRSPVRAQQPTKARKETAATPVRNHEKGR